MKYAFLLLAALGGLLVLLASRVARNADPDVVLSAVIPAFLGILCLVLDVVLVLGFALYRVFST